MTEIKEDKNKTGKGAVAPTRTERAAQVLAEAVAELMNAESYKAALRFRQKLYSYSFRNALLIYQQMPNATLLAGYKKWQTLGRQVKKGEKSLLIFAPLIKKGDHGAAEVFGFRAAATFDVSQTEGEAVPLLPQPELLNVEHEGIDGLTKLVSSWLCSQGFSVKTQNIKGANGYYTANSKAIVISNQLSPVQAFKTLLHEAAHALLHTHECRTDESLHIFELEAETVAFLVCDALLLDSSTFSFAYLANWAEKPEELLSITEKACKCADGILQTLEAHELTLAT